MFYQHLKILFRTLNRQKLNSLITISGIVLGLTAVLLAYIFISDEWGFDQFHAKAERLYRVNKHYTEPSGDRSKNAETPGRLAEAMDNDYPEVEVAAHIAPWFSEVLISYDDQHIETENWVFADSNFFRLFDFNLLKGGLRSEVLSKPGQVLLTPKLAKALFGDQNPIGKTIVGLSDQLYTVSGIIEESPRQSHLKYDLIASWASTESNSGVHDFSFMNNWLGQTVYTYVLLRKPEQFAAVNEKLKGITAKYMPNRVDRYEFYLQPLPEIYLNSDDIQYLRGGKYGSATFLRTFSIIALLILLIACFNYINITTARSLQRAKEVGVKKVMGARGSEIVKQFLTETLGLTVVSACFSIILASLTLPSLNHLFDKDIPLNILFQPQSFLFLLSIILVVSIFSGLFPGLLLNKFRPAIALRNHLRISPGGQIPRQVLTTLQLSISMGLITATLLLHQQFQFLLNRDLGFDQEQVLVMKTPAGIDSTSLAFNHELKKLPGVKSISICQAAMGEGTFGSTIIPEGYNGEELPIQVFRVDSNYMQTYGLELTEGRFINQTSDFSTGAMVVNEAFAKQAGWDNSIGKTLQFPGSTNRSSVVGVIKDFNYVSLHQTVSPVIMYLDNRTSHISVRFEPQQLASLLPQLEQLWNRFESRYAFNYYFTDEYFAKSYQSEQRMVRVITSFAGLAILIACLGLYGLASFTMARRRKEIGIRKILGASIPSILRLLSQNFMRLSFIAMLISIPVAYYFLQGWLENFSYHVNLSWPIFMIAGTLLLIIVFLTVSIQSLQAALGNPVESLKVE